MNPAGQGSAPSVGERLVWAATLLLAVGAAAVFVFGVVYRLAYPHELEWMEGAIADQATRVVDGLPLYTAPGPDYVPFLYPPLQPWLGAVGILMGLDALLALRLVAVLATLVGAGTIFGWVRRETASVRHGVAAAGVFLAGHGWLAWWYDLARNDTLCVAGVLATGALLRSSCAWRWLWAALAATVAVLAKQTAFVWLLGMAVGAFALDRRVAWRFLAGFLVTTGAVLGVMHVASNGWSTFFLWTLPGQHGFVDDRWVGFWTEDMVPLVPLAALAGAGVVAMGCRGRVRDGCFFAAVAGGGLVASWLSRLHVGGFDNVLMYGFVGLTVVGVIGGSALAWSRAVPLLLGVQFVLLGLAACRRDAGSFLPPSAHARAHGELAAFVAAQPGPVWLLAHGYISTRAGRGSWAHGQALLDVLQLLPKTPDGTPDFLAVVDRRRLDVLPPRHREAVTGLLDGTVQALRERRFAAIVLEGVVEQAFVGIFGAGLTGDDGRLGTDDDPYVPDPAPLLSEPTALRALVGTTVHSPRAYRRRP